jgi:hypothetical protein
MVVGGAVLHGMVDPEGKVGMIFQTTGKHTPP